MGRRLIEQEIVGLSLKMQSAKTQQAAIRSRWPERSAEEQAEADKEWTRLQGVIDYCIWEVRRLREMRRRRDGR